MRPTDVLRDEHEQILRACAILHAMAERVDADAPIDPADASIAVDFVRLYADGLHHAKEELVLFPALEVAGMPRRSGPIAVMLNEHDRGRELVSLMAASLAAFPEARARTSFADGARGFATLLEQHIAKENNILFVMAERLLPPTRDGELLDAYAARESEARETCGEKAAHEEALSALARRWL